MQVQVLQATVLTVRVVNNTSKLLDVKPLFLENFKDDGYPGCFPYKQKVVNLAH